MVGEGLPGAETLPTPATWGAGRLIGELGVGRRDSWGWLAKRCGCALGPVRQEGAQELGRGSVWALGWGAFLSLGSGGQIAGHGPQPQPSAQGQSPQMNSTLGVPGHRTLGPFVFSSLNVMLI